MPYQTVTLNNRDDQVVIRTPFGAVVVSAQQIGDHAQVYVTPPEDFKRLPRKSGATTIFEHAKEVPA